MISLNSKAFTTVGNKFGLSDRNQQRGRQTRSNRSQISHNRMINLNSNVRNTENSDLHRYVQKDMLSLLHQFPFEYVTLKHKQVGDYNSKREPCEFCLCLPWYLFMSCWCFSGNLCALSNLRIRNDFTDLNFNICTHYMSSREDSSLLREIPEPVWSWT